MIENLIRSVIWILIQAAGWICDNLFKLCLEISSLDFMNLKLNGEFIIWKMWNGLSIFIVIAVCVRIFIFFIKLISNPEKVVGKMNLIKKLLAMMVISTLITNTPTIMQTVGSVAINITNNINYQLGLEDNTPPSTIILTLINNKNSKEPLAEKIGSDVGNNKQNEGEKSPVVVSFDKISDINNAPLFEDYYWFPNTYDLIIILMVMGMTSLSVFSISLDIAKRWFEGVALILISFIPISSLLDDESVFYNWVKMIFGVYLSNYMELYLMIATMIITSALYKVANNPFVPIVILIAGLLFTLNGSQTIARVLGVETSGSTLQQLSQIAQITRPLGALSAAPVLLAKKGANKVGLGIAKGYRGGMWALGGVGVGDYGKFKTNISTNNPLNSNQPLSQKIKNDLNKNDQFKNAYSNNNQNPGLNNSNESFSNKDNTNNPSQANGNINTSYNYNELYRKGSALYNFSEKMQKEGMFKQSVGNFMDRAYEKSLKKAQNRKGISR